MLPVRLTDAQRDAALTALPAWTYDQKREAFYRHVQFNDFTEALGTMVRIGVIAEKADHHPEWSNVYDRLSIWLTTHDANGVTERDVALAMAIDRIVGRQSALSEQMHQPVSRAW